MTIRTKKILDIFSPIHLFLFLLIFIGTMEPNEVDKKHFIPQHGK
jgi:hypothetical protein